MSSVDLGERRYYLLRFMTPEYLYVNDDLSYASLSFGFGIGKRTDIANLVGVLIFFAIVVFGLYATRAKSPRELLADAKERIKQLEDENAKLRTME